jgi:predicted dehydrogenase
MGMIGVGAMGTGRLREFLSCDDVRIAAVCDVDSNHLDRAVAEVEKSQQPKPKVFGDFRRLLEDQEIDAVAIVTPDHWHAIPFVGACRAGKDVFVEKPLSYSIQEGRAMVDAAAAHGTVTQMGNHIHNDLPNYRRVVEMVQSGNLGRITRVHCWKTAPDVQRGSPPDEDPPPELNYDFWLGPAPKRPYNPLRSHRTFRHFWDYSSGTFIDFWCHITDVAVWALDLQAPRSASAVGGRFFVQDATETPDAVEAVLEYPELTFVYTYHRNPLPGLEHMGHIGCVFQGSEATLVTNYEKHEILVEGEKVTDFPRPDPTIPDSPGHLREFLNAIKTGNTNTTCNVDYGHRLTKGGHIAGIAFRTGDKLYWDDQSEKILNNRDANRMLGRVFRRPWSL